MTNYLTKTDLARALGVGERTIARMVADGRLPPGVKIGPKTLRWPADMIDQHIRGRAVVLSHRPDQAPTPQAD